MTLDRRDLLRSAAAGGALLAGGGVLCGCGGGAGGASTGSTAGRSSASIATSKVPVGGGIILDALGGVVVVQPAAGVFRAYNASCQHQGCKVGSVDGATITCPCHGSQFSIVDGAVTHGPALRGLTAMTATVEGGNVVVA